MRQASTVILAAKTGVTALDYSVLLVKRSSKNRWAQVQRITKIAPIVWLVVGLTNLSGSCQVHMFSQVELWSHMIRILGGEIIVAGEVIRMN